MSSEEKSKTPTEALDELVHDALYSGAVNDISANEKIVRDALNSLSALSAELAQHKKWLSLLERQTGVYITRGQELLKSDFPELFKAVTLSDGGEGGEGGEFKLPDLRGQLIKGAEADEEVGDPKPK